MIDDIGLKAKKYAVCGKTFYPAPMHVYKRQHRNGMKWFCAYHCLVEWDREHYRKYNTVT